MLAVLACPLFSVLCRSKPATLHRHTPPLNTMSRASQIEQENDSQFHLLANKVSAFKNIANDINSYAQEDNSNLGSINDQLSTLGENIKSTASRLGHVMRANPKITRMVGVGFAIFLVIYYSLKYLF